MADAHVKHHDYHLVDPSPWPIIGAVGAFLTAVGFIYAMHVALPEDATTADYIFRKWGFAVPGFLIVLYTMYGWWAQVVSAPGPGLLHRLGEGPETRVVDVPIGSVPERFLGPLASLLDVADQRSEARVAALASAMDNQLWTDRIEDAEPPGQTTTSSPMSLVAPEVERPSRAPAFAIAAVVVLAAGAAVPAATWVSK